MESEDFVAFVKALDECWMQSRFEDLPAYLAQDVVLVSPDGKQRIEGISKAVDSYYEFVSTARVDEFSSFDYVITQRGGAVVVEYGWLMRWEMGDTINEDRGREVLVLAQRNEEWRVVWRTQIPA
jgi:hypothetical protein